MMRKYLLFMIVSLVTATIVSAGGGFFDPPIPPMPQQPIPETPQDNEPIEIDPIYWCNEDIELCDDLMGMEQAINDMKEIVGVYDDLYEDPFHAHAFGDICLYERYSEELCVGKELSLVEEQQLRDIIYDTPFFDHIRSPFDDEYWTVEVCLSVYSGFDYDIEECVVRELSWFEQMRVKTIIEEYDNKREIADELMDELDDYIDQLDEDIIAGELLLDNLADSPEENQEIIELIDEILDEFEDLIIQAELLHGYIHDVYIVEEIFDDLMWQLR